MPLHNKTIIGGVCVAGISTLTGSGFGIYSSLQDKTIKDRLITLGKKLINNKDVFEIAYKENKEETGFKTLINVGENAQLDKAGEALSTWCKNSLALPLTEDNIKKVLSNTSKYCTLPIKTIKEKLDKLGKKLIKDWTSKWEEIKSTAESTDLKQDLMKVNNTISAMKADQHATVWKNALSNWCSSAIDNTLLVNDKDDTIFKKIETRCLETTTTKGNT